eukprot:1191028-Rhodomonas_salina.1
MCPCMCHAPRPSRPSSLDPCIHTILHSPERKGDAKDRARTPFRWRVSRLGKEMAGDAHSNAYAGQVCTEPKQQ